MVTLSMIMMDELGDAPAQGLLTEEDHPLQALALDRQNKPFGVSAQILRTDGCDPQKRRSARLGVRVF